MAEDWFWRVIDEARQRTGHLEDQVKFLDEAFAQLSLAELTNFHGALMEAHRRSYTDKLWAAFDLAIGYTGEDTFTDARSWLILQGRADFDRVLTNPDEIATLNFDNVDELGLAEQFVAAVINRLQQRLEELNVAVDLELPEDLMDLRDGSISRDLADLRSRYPRIAAKYVPVDATELTLWPPTQ